MRSRRDFLTSAAAALAYSSGARPLRAFQSASHSRSQRIVVVMFDGFGLDYLAQSDMPTLRRWQRDGLYKQVKGMMPSVTNANNSSICCGVFPKEHGITGNSYFDPGTGHEEYMETADLLMAPTLFEHAAKLGISSALVSSKKKTISLLSRGATISLTPEEAPAEWVDRLGPAPAIYSREINYWTVRAAIHILKHRPEIQCLYVHTTDYPMHTWAPDAPESKEHLKTIDTLLGEACEAAPDAAFLLTADHGMNAKTLCWDLERVCEAKGVPLRKAFSVGRDRYVKQHRGCSGGAYVYLKNPQDADRVREIVSALKGVEHVIPRDVAARDYKLMKSRIGDFVVWGDKDTVFGEMDMERVEFPTGLC